jgi:hypothetical protein
MGREAARGSTVSGSVEEALQTPAVVLVDYTSAAAVKEHVRAVDVRAARFLRSDGVVDGHFELRSAGLRHAPCELARHPARRVHLPRVRAVDDLPIREVLRASTANFCSSAAAMAKLPTATTPT